MNIVQTTPSSDLSQNTLIVQTNFSNILFPVPITYMQTKQRKKNKTKQNIVNWILISTEFEIYNVIIPDHI